MNGREPVVGCEEVERLLFELRDGVLEGVAAESVRSHLAGCPSCRGAQAWDVRLHDLLHDEVLPEPPPGLAAAVSRRVRRRRRIRAALVGAAAALLLAGAGVAWRLRTEPGAAVVDAKTTSAPGNGDDLPESLVLFQPPPVDSLDVLSRQHSGYVAVLQTLGKE
jgi:Putative zinc-finger